MLFRTNNGELIEINRYNYPNDKLYYKKIMEVKQSFSKSFLSSTKSEKTFNKQRCCKEIA
jgi:hypothetical protein